MSTWDAVVEELNIWSDVGRDAVFWWRDDDAQDATPALDQLLDLSGQHQVPVALAVIPGLMTPGLPERLKSEKSALFNVVQHGFRHENHADPTAKNSEFPETRLFAEMLGDVAIGYAGLDHELADYLCPVFVPPWNRIAPGFVPRLVNAGLTGLSTYGDLIKPQTTPGLRQINTHIDLIAWRGNRNFIGQVNILNSILELLQKRRHSSAERVEPIGLLTHHLDMDAASWAFCADFFDFISRQPAAQWLSATELFTQDQ